MTDRKRPSNLPPPRNKNLYLLGHQQRTRALPRLKIGRHILLLTRDEVIEASAAIGRCREFMESTENNLRHCGSAIRKGVSFIDDEGFTAMYQRGVWLFRRFHRRVEAELLSRRFIGADASYLRSSSSWSVAGSKTVQCRFVEQSIAREFDLPLPDGSRLGRSKDVLTALKVAQIRAR